MPRGVQRRRAENVNVRGADHASEDSDSDDLPPEESLKETRSILWEVSELGGANDDTLFVVPDGAEFGEIDLRHNEAFTA
jgi:hypothetical protein